MKLKLQTVSFAADAMRMLNGARLSVNGLYSKTGVDWLIAAGINFNSTTALRFCRSRGTALEQYNGSSECKTVTRRETESRRRKSRRETWKIPDHKGVYWTTCEDVQASESTPRPCERKRVSETSESGS